MFDIWASLAELHQPCLYRRIGDRLLGTDGLVRREILNSLDRLFCEHLAAGRASFQAPIAPPPIPVEQRFLNVSALQKSIRRGDADGAMRYAQQGCALDAEQVFRRLATCAVEDVGIGNLLVVGMALAVMGNRAMRENGAPAELAAYLAYILAISPKSRLACDLLSIADYDRSLAPLKRRLALATPEELAASVADRDAPLRHRIVAGWLLAGTARFRGATMPRVSRGRGDFMRLMAARRVPLMLYYIADRAAARLSDAMFVSMLPIADILSPEPEYRVIAHDLSDTGMISGYPSAAYDLHTYEGRTALSRFGRECLQVAELLRALSPTMRDTAIRHAVFIAEGGRLTEQVCFPAADRIEAQAHHAELAFVGLVDQTAQATLLDLVRSNLGFLNRVRASIERSEP